LCFSPRPHSKIQIALDMFGLSGNGASVRSVARELDLSQRQFIQIFNDQVGLTPKLFCRLLRFQNARVLAERLDRCSWAQIASTCGYFDQAHLISDFQEFSGLSPTNYIRQHGHDGRLKDSHVPFPG